MARVQLTKLPKPVLGTTLEWHQKFRAIGHLPALLLMLALSANCAEPDWVASGGGVIFFPIDVQVNMNLSDGEKVAIEQATEFWNNETERTVFRVMFVEQTNRAGCGWVGFDHGEDGMRPLGSTYPNRCFANVVLNKRNSAVFETAVHELGHVVGLEHSEDTRNIMFERLKSHENPHWLTDDQVDQVRYAVDNSL